MLVGRWTCDNGRNEQTDVEGEQLGNLFGNSVDKKGYSQFSTGARRMSLVSASSDSIMDVFGGRRFAYLKHTSCYFVSRNLNTGLFSYGNCTDT